MAWIAILVMVLALFLIPIGLPGLWIMIGVLAIGTLYHRVGVTVLLLALSTAILAELLEYVVVKRLTARYGGSRKAFWGAVAGGIIGVMIGLPVPIIGSIVAAFIGSFAGAALVALIESRELASAGRVGWGALLGRSIAAGVKVFAGVVILVLGAFAFLT